MTDELKSDFSVQLAKDLEKMMLGMGPQIKLKTVETLHDGVFCRSCLLPAGVAMSGAFLKIPTTLIVNGNCSVTGAEDMILVEGYRQFEAPAERKNVFLAHEDTWVTMIFKTDAQSIAEAKRIMTDDILGESR